MYHITTFREYIQTNGTRLEKLKMIKEFMWNEFYTKRAIEKEAIHDSENIIRDTLNLLINHEKN